MTWRERRRRRAQLEEAIEQRLAELAEANRRIEATTVAVLEQVEEMNERASAHGV